MSSALDFGRALALWQHKAHIGPLTERQTAVLCALTAARYDNQPRGLGLGVTEFWFPEEELAAVACEPDGAQRVRQEGWIYFPKLDGGTD